MTLIVGMASFMPQGRVSEVVGSLGNRCEFKSNFPLKKIAILKNAIFRGNTSYQYIDVMITSLQ